MDQIPWKILLISGLGSFDSPDSSSCKQTWELALTSPIEEGARDEAADVGRPVVGRLPVVGRAERPRLAEAARPDLTL